MYKYNIFAHCSCNNLILCWSPTSTVDYLEGEIQSLNVSRAILNHSSPTRDVIFFKNFQQLLDIESVSFFSVHCKCYFKWKRFKIYLNIPDMHYKVYKNKNDDYKKPKHISLNCSKLAICFVKRYTYGSFCTTTKFYIITIFFCPLYVNIGRICCTDHNWR